MKQWLQSTTASAGQTLSLRRDPSPDNGGVVPGQLTWYDYGGKTNTEFEGTQIQPLLVARILPNGTTAFVHTDRNSFGTATAVIQTYSVGTSILLRTNSYTYAANEIDLLSVTNAQNVLVASNAFNDFHEVTNTYDALNELTAFTYDSKQRLSSITYPTGLVTTNIYGTNNYLAEFINVGFSTNSFTYANGLVSTSTDARGLVLSNTWDNLQRLTSVTFPDSTYISNQYTFLDLTATKDRLNNWTYFGYDSMRRNIAVTNALGHYTLFDYCICGALESIQDTLGNLTTFSYNNQGRATNVVYPDGTSITTSYNLMGQATNVTDGRGVSATDWYDNQGLVIAVSNALGQVSLLSYDILDRVTNRVNANGVSVGMTYDVLNRLLTDTHPDGGVNLYGYSAAGLIAYTNQLTNTTRYAYDAAGRKIATTNANGQVTQYTYDGANDRTSVTDQKGNVTQWGYDVYGRNTNKVDATGATILKYGYDADNRLTNRWSAQKGNTAYGYDNVGNLTEVTYPVSPSQTFLYDAMNRLTNMSDGIGTTSFAYTQTGQLASETGPWPSDTVTYSYSDGLRATLALQQPNASAWVQNYGYDTANRLESIASPAGMFDYTYNLGLAGTASSSGLVANIALPDGAFITNTFDNNARMLSTSLKNSVGTALDSYSYTYNVGNQRTTVERSGENTANYTYDLIGQVIADQASEVSGGAPRWNEQLSYGYDAAGNLSYRTNNALVQNFAVDSLNELTTNTNGGTLTVVGTTTSPATNVTVNGNSAAIYGDATFAATNQPLTTTYAAVAQDGYGRIASNTVTVSLSTNVPFQYDANGNLTNDGLRSFAYDDENQLIQVWVTNQWMSQFTYDGKMRRRIRQEFTWNGGWTQTNAVYYVYDGNLVIQERDLNNLPTTTYTRGLDLSGTLQGAGGIGGLLARSSQQYADASTAGQSFYHSDANGNVTMLINSSQAVVAKYLYDAFGNILSKSGLLSDANLYRFSSKEYEQNSGLLYFLYRYCDPNLQRWLNRDPISEAGGLNLYEFAGNAPVGQIDPIGKDGEDADASLNGVNGYPALTINGPVGPCGGPVAVSDNSSRDPAVWAGIGVATVLGTSGIGAIAEALGVGTAVGAGASTLIAGENAADTAAPAYTSATRAFWTGETTGLPAAQASGASVLQLTPEAQAALANGNPSLMFQESANWAAGATGETAPVFVGSGQGYTFWNYEFPQLMNNLNNGNLNSVTIHF